jgi:HPt (histidine-containing phosphotransfer) domain-containing protein
VAGRRRKIQGQFGGNMAEAAVFDRAHLARYTMDSPELEREVVELFVAQLPSILVSLHNANTAEDWRIAIHTIKGSALAIGAVRISEIAKNLESISGFHGTEARQKLLADLNLAAQEFDALAQRLYR